MDDRIHPTFLPLEELSPEEENLVLEDFDLFPEGDDAGMDIPRDDLYVVGDPNREQIKESWEYDWTKALE